MGVEVYLITSSPGMTLGGETECRLKLLAIVASINSSLMELVILCSVSGFLPKEKTLFLRTKSKLMMLKLTKSLLHRPLRLDQRPHKVKPMVQVLLRLLHQQQSTKLQQLEQLQQHHRKTKPVQLRRTSKLSVLIVTLQLVATWQFKS